MVNARPPQILQICREPLKAGSEAAYRAIEESTARLAAALGCPHPYLGAQSLVDSTDVWWFNGYESSAEQQQVYDDYAKNTPLTAALQENGKRKAMLTLDPIEMFATYRQELSVGTPWILGRGRYLVMTVTKSGDRIAGTVFEAFDGTRFIVTAVGTREQADAANAQAGPGSTILAVRPSWSFPAEQWIAADPEFWQSS
jgi:hypothetical protein